MFRRLGSITTNIGHLTLEKFKASPFPLPPAAEQARIVAEVERLFTVIDHVEPAVVESLRRADGLRRSVLHAAFTGSLVCEPELVTA